MEEFCMVYLKIYIYIIQNILPHMKREPDIEFIVQAVV